MEPFLTSTLLVALAEVGDKTQLLSFVLAARLRRPGAILAGILAATLLNHALAGAAGILIAKLLPAQTLRWIVGASFIGFGLWALRRDALDKVPAFGGTGAFTTALIAFFLMEMGDKTQLATVALAARFDALLQVIAGTTAGMMIANLPAVWFGDRMARAIPVEGIRYVAAALFIVSGVLTLWSGMSANV